MVERREYCGMSENTVRRRQHEGKHHPDTDGMRLIPVCVIASTCVNAEHTEGGGYHPPYAQGPEQAGTSCRLLS